MLHPPPKLCMEMSNWQNVKRFFQRKSTISFIVMVHTLPNLGVHFRDNYIFRGSMQDLLHSDVLKRGFGFPILFMIPHWAHGEPCNQWIIFPTKSLQSWKLLTCNVWWSKRQAFNFNNKCCGHSTHRIIFVHVSTNKLWVNISTKYPCKLKSFSCYKFLFEFLLWKCLHKPRDLIWKVHLYAYVCQLCVS